MEGRVISSNGEKRQHLIVAFKEKIEGREKPLQIILRSTSRRKKKKQKQKHKGLEWEIPPHNQK